jgi:uncharacterized membrane-anchored protein
MIHVILAMFLLLGLLAPPALAIENEPMTTEEQEWLVWAKGIWASLNQQTGSIALPGGVATLEVPEDFYYLDPDDAQRILVEVWGNPPGEKSLGMLFPAGSTPFDDQAWGVTIDYEEEGYVEDTDAAEINYDELLEQMQEDTRVASRERLAAGYEEIELIGWAARPFYDEKAHKLHWAKELAFGPQKTRSLNYNIRVLGRKGVLVLNFIAGMDQLPEIQSNLSNVLAMADFDDGSRYEDFDPEYDKIAAYGIGGLIAGKVLAKTGLFVVLLAFAKKFGVIILAAGGALAAKFFKAKEKPEA